MDQIAITVMWVAVFWEVWSFIAPTIVHCFEKVCGYTGGCIKCTSEGLKLVVLSDNYTTCCTPNIATVGAEYINVYEKPSDCPGWLEKRENEHEIIIASVGCVIGVAVIALLWFLLRAWRRRTHGALPLAPRTSMPYSVAYHAKNPVYEEVYNPTTISLHSNADGQGSTMRRETAAILPVTPLPAVYEACGPSQRVAVWDPNENEDVTAEEMRDFNTLRQWGRVQKKTHKKEEWMEMTVFK